MTDTPSESFSFVEELEARLAKLRSEREAIDEYLEFAAAVDRETDRCVEHIEVMARLLEEATPESFEKLAIYAKQFV